MITHKQCFKCKSILSRYWPGDMCNVCQPIKWSLKDAEEEFDFDQWQINSQKLILPPVWY